MPSTKVGVGLVLRRLLTLVLTCLWTVSLSSATFLALMTGVMIVRVVGAVKKKKEEEEINVNHCQSLHLHTSYKITKFL